MRSLLPRAMVGVCAKTAGDLLISCEALEREARPLLQGRTGTWFCSEHRPADEAGSEPLVRERR